MNNAQSAADPNGGAPPKSGAVFVAIGILLSRLFGFVREAVFAHYFGNSWVADAFKGALRIPNFLQNLLGEGVLSASFIPVYVGLRSQGDEREARALANAVVTLLFLLTAILSLAGILWAAALVDFITPGFFGEKRKLAILLVRIFFPSASLLVLSAWCLGILNSHRRFFLPYVSPVLWNLAIIVALIGFGRRYDGAALAVWVAGGVVVGSALQFLVQLPTVLALLGRLRPQLGRGMSALRQVLTNFMPVVLGRGVVQISAFIDTMIASFLPPGGLATLTYAQTLYLLPVSLFGMSVSAAELPALSGISAQHGDVRQALRERVTAAAGQISFFVIPCIVMFIALGDLVVGGLYQSGRFTAADTLAVWATLAALSLGLFASTHGRLYASTFYALQDPKTPLRCAVIRVVLAVILGILLGLYLPRLLALDSWGVVGLAFAAGISAWLEYALLKTALKKRIGEHEERRDLTKKLLLIAAAGALITLVLRQVIPPFRPLWTAVILLPCFGGFYLLGAFFAGVPSARRILAPLISRERPGS